MRVHGALGHGFLESVYKNALAHEFAKAGIPFEMEKPLDVFYEGKIVGHFSADFLVEGRVIAELKATSALSKADAQQLVNYLKAADLDTGLLLNFGTQSLEFKRKVRTLPRPNLHE